MIRFNKCNSNFIKKNQSVNKFIIFQSCTFKLILSLKPIHVKII
jgi:hypothetical protein